MEKPGDISSNLVVMDDSKLSSCHFTMIPNEVLRDSKLSIPARLTLGILLSYAWQKNYCFPSQTTIAKDLGVGSSSIKNLRRMKKVVDF